MDVENSRLLVSVAGERNALSHRQEEDSVTCIRRRRRAATQSDDDPEKRANDTNELSTAVDAHHAVPSLVVYMLTLTSSASRVPPQRSQTQQAAIVGLCHILN